MLNKGVWGQGRQGHIYLSFTCEVCHEGCCEDGGGGQGREDEPGLEGAPAATEHRVAYDRQ